MAGPSAVLPAASATAHHLLLVPAAAAPADVEALVLSRHPEAVATLDGGRTVVTVAPGLAVDGPWWPPPGARIPDWVRACYLLTAPVQRGPAVPAELRGRGGLLDAFADGEPVGAERALLELGLAVARRLGGAVRPAGGAAPLLVPEARPDLLVHADAWLHPDALVHVLAPHLPGIALPGRHDGRRSARLPADAVRRPSLLQDEGERAWLHAEADAYDAAALERPDVTESYGAVATDADGTVWSVTVEAAAVVPPVLASVAERCAILYELRCHPAGGAPPPDAVARLDAAARALLDAVGGHVVDDDGFLVDVRA